MNSKHKSSICADEISGLLVPFGIKLSALQLRQVADYTDLLTKWNRRLNLTSIDNPQGIIARHFGECMFGGQIFKIGDGRLADVGSGAGFPGIALKILFPDLELTLIESNKKKCAFLAEVVRSLDLLNVTIAGVRFGETDFPLGSINTICARALGQFGELLTWSKNILASGGSLALWLGEGDAVQVSQMSGWIWKEALSIPESERRVILVGSPVRF